MEERLKYLEEVELERDEAMRRMSIMKLDQSSMEKLLILMIMSVKKETFLLSSPLELYSLTIGNLEVLKKYVKGGEGQTSVDTAIKHLRDVADKLSFMQFLNLRNTLLSALEATQTKIINFAESGQQTNSAKLVYGRRNKHNLAKVGHGENHPDRSINETTAKLFLDLGEWKDWRSSLVHDHAEEYEKQSEQRQLKEMEESSGKEKGVNSLFDFSKQTSLTDFQVRLDVFGEDTEPAPAVTKSQVKKEEKEGVRVVGQSRGSLTETVRQQIEEEL